MKQILMITCGMLLMSSVVLADDITTETCANGAGTVISGAVTGHKYCMSNNPMNWWNAISWCDAQGRRLFMRNDCACSDAVANCSGSKCAELDVGILNEKLTWTGEAFNGQKSCCAYNVELSTTQIQAYSNGRSNTSRVYALCY